VTRDPGVPPLRPIGLATVAMLAAGYFAIGIRLALGWPRGWIDSGLVVYGSWRVAHGALPYRDFDHVYGPAVFYLNGGLLYLFGPDLAVLAVSLIVLKAVLAVLVFALARTVASARIAAATTLLLVVVWGAPLWLFGAPYAQHYGIVCTLAGLLCLARATRGRRRALAAAGLWAGVAATFKVTSGLFALVAFVLFALASTAPCPRAAEVRAGAVRAFRVAAACAALAAGVLYALASVPSDADVARLVTVAILAAPFAWAAASVLRGELGRGGDRRTDARGAGDVLAVVAAAALPPLAWVAFYLAHGAGGDLARDLLVVPPLLEWFVPLRAPSPLAALVVATAGLAVVSARAERSRWQALVAAFSAAAVVALVVAGWPAGTGWGMDLARRAPVAVAYDVVYYVPVLSVLVGLPLLRARPDAGREAEGACAVARLYLLFAAANLLLLLPAADIWHGFMVLPACLPLVAHLLAARPRPRGGAEGAAAPVPPGRRALAAVPLALVVVLALPFVMQLETTRQSWSGATARFVRASGITHPSAKFDDVAALVRHLDTGPARDRSVFVLTGEAMIYFLAGRVSALDQQELLMYTLARGVASPRSASLLADDRRVARRLKAERPLVVDDISHPTRDSLSRFLPRTARVLAKHYRPRERFGSYEVLDR